MKVRRVRFEVKDSVTHTVISRNYTTRANAEAAAIRVRKPISLDIVRIEGDCEVVSYATDGAAHPLDP
jgi:hypothetical protein